jgi:hypothetical protein
MTTTTTTITPQLIFETCAKALHFDNQHQHEQALYNYGCCISLIGQYIMMNKSSSSTTTMESLVNTCSQCIHRVNDITQLLRNNNNTTTTTTTNTKPFQQMNVQELTQQLIVIDEDIKQRKNQLDQLMKEKANRKLITDLSYKYEETQLIKSQMEQYLQQIIQKRQGEELKKSVQSTTTNNKTNPWLLLIIKHFANYRAMSDVVSIDQLFLDRIPIVRSVESFVVKHFHQISSEQVHGHPLYYLLKDFHSELNHYLLNEQQIQSRKQHAVHIIKLFSNYLSEHLYTIWNHSNTLIPHELFSKCILHLVLESNYTMIINLYRQEPKDKDREMQLRKLKSASMSINDFLPSEYDSSISSYQSSISKLSQLHAVKIPEEQYSILEKVIEYSNITVVNKKNMLILLHIILQSNVLDIYSICNYIEDYSRICNNTTSTSIILDIIRSAVNESLEIEPTIRKQTETTTSILDDFIMTVKDEELIDVCNNGGDGDVDGDDLLKEIDLDNKMTLLMSSSTQSEIQQLKNELAERDEQILAMNEERDKLVKNFLNQISILSAEKIRRNK